MLSQPFKFLPIDKLTQVFLHQIYRLCGASLYRNCIAYYIAVYTYVYGSYLSVGFLCATVAAMIEL